MDFNYWLQSRLTAHGFPVGIIDGVIGENTIKALKAFEASRKLKVDGLADSITVEELRKPSSLVDAETAKVIVAKTPTEKKIQAIRLVPTVWPRQSEVEKFFGPVGQDQTHIEVPFDFYLAWSKSTRVSKISVHQKVASSAEAALEKIASIYTSRERADIGINLFGGSFNVRRMRGGMAFSMHSWGIAIDFDPERNQLKWPSTKARLAEPDAAPFLDVWQNAGWLSLGRARDYDWMHVQAARL